MGWLIFSIIVFFMGVKVKAEETPNNLYRIYLNGEVIGLIEKKEELLDLIKELNERADELARLGIKELRGE